MNNFKQIGSLILVKTIIKCYDVNCNLVFQSGDCRQLLKHVIFHTTLNHCHLRITIIEKKGTVQIEKLKNHRKVESGAYYQSRRNRIFENDIL